MDRLPPELLHGILLQSVRQHRCEKNEVLALRFVCKSFDAVLRPYLFKTLQLEFSRFARSGSAPGLPSLHGVCHLADSLYCDMMVIRDEEEIERLRTIFSTIIEKVPEMDRLLNSLQKYCMTPNTFDESDFLRVLTGVLSTTPNLRRLKLNLPFQVIGCASRVATLLLATTFACFHKRPEGFARLETLVLDHVSDTTVLDISRNPIDIEAAIWTLSTLKHLVLSIKRQESGQGNTYSFSIRLWFLLSHATELESLCLTGWNTKRVSGKRLHISEAPISDWTMRSLPYHGLASDQAFRHLQQLELRRVDIEGAALIQMIEQNCHSLKELYLNEVFLKVHSTVEHKQPCLWVGCDSFGDDSLESLHIAHILREMPTLRLDVLRASGLGYDERKVHRLSPEPSKYDLVDPYGLHRCFDLRFVEAYLGLPDPSPSYQIPPFINHRSAPTELTAADLAVDPVIDGSHNSLPPIEYDVEEYQKRHNTTSHWKRCIDGLFYNHNETTLVEVQKIINVAERGMSLLAEEIDRIHAMTHLPHDT